MGIPNKRMSGPLSRQNGNNDVKNAQQLVDKSTLKIFLKGKGPLINPV